MRGARQALLTGAVALAMAPVAMPAHADTTYRYWSYWTGGDTWTYSSRGPGFRVPADGGVEGWRFVVSPRSGSQATPPDAASSFNTLCPAAAPAAEGQKRIAVVIDFGAPGIAPVGEATPARSVACVAVPTAATGLQVLQKVAQVRFHSSGLICGIAGFPASECPGQTAQDPSASPTRATTRGGPPAPAAAPTPPVSARPPREASSSPATSTRATPTASTYDQPSPVALPLASSAPDPAGTAPPAWLAAIGAAMIGALLGLTAVIRRGRG